jgi:Regulator of ribonuclease activity B
MSSGRRIEMPFDDPAYSEPIPGRKKENDVINELMTAAAADIDVLRVLDNQRDVFSTAREVDFLFRTDVEKQAHAVAGFLSDFQYARTSYERDNSEHRVLATIVMPVEQNVILSVSGFMLLIAKLFSVSYDGWGTIAQPAGPSGSPAGVGGSRPHK